MELEIMNQVSQADEAAVFEGLLEYNLAHLEVKEREDLGVYLRDGKGRIIAGLVGNTFGAWLTVKYLWVSQTLRGQGIGCNILQNAEREASRRGCRYVFLDTYGFQAAGFYRKYGYVEAFTLEHYPLEGKRHYFTKTLE